MYKILFPLVILALFLFSGCTTRMPDVIVHEEKPAPVVQEATLEDGAKDPEWVAQALQKEYKKWEDVPYLYGGETLRGTDCSSLVRHIYQDAFDITLPRSSVDQAKVGEEVRKGSCKEGDLVFFKINAKTHHSGIIVEKGKFLHASTKEGVKISRLNNPYWKNKLVKIKRIIPDDELIPLKPSK